MAGGVLSRTQHLVLQTFDYGQPNPLNTPRSYEICVLSRGKDGQRSKPAVINFTHCEDGNFSGKYSYLVSHCAAQLVG